MGNLDAVEIGKRLRILRGDRPQKEVADALGLTCMAVSSYETGKRIPSDRVKIALAQYYGQTVEQIFFYPISKL